MKKIIFVYNAEEGFFNGLLDTLHKIISPRTYPCKLCAITYGNFSMYPEWKQFLESLHIEKEFYHRRDFYTKFPEWQTLKLPAVLYQDEKMEILISDDDFNSINSIDDLKKMIDNGLRKYDHL